MFDYLLTESEVLWENIKLRLWLIMARRRFGMHCLWKPALDPWALRENNVLEWLELANQIIGYKFKLYTKSTL